MKKRKKNDRTDKVKPASENYPMEDRVLKAAARFMGRELLPLLGVEGTMKRMAPTEAVFLEVKDFLADFNYEMTDGTWKHLEFESDSISLDDLRRFRAWEAIISYHYKTTVSTYVLCSSKTAVLRDCLTEGLNTYRVQIVRIKNRNADQVLKSLEEKQREKSLDREDLLDTLLTPLMDGEMSQKDRIEKGFGILVREQEHMEKEELIQMQSVLYALAMKFLSADEIKKMKEMIAMTLMGQMLMEDGIAKGMEKGIEKGEFKTLQELIQDGLLTKTEAAARKEMTVEEFQKKLGELKLV